MVGEQSVQAVGRNAHGHGIEAPPALISLEHLRCAWIEPEARRVSDGFGKRRTVTQDSLEPLPGDGMDYVSGAPDQRQPLADKAPRSEQPEWKRTSRPHNFNVAELQAEAFFELGVKFAVGQRNNALCFTESLGPHDRATPAPERQDCHKARRPQMRVS